MTRSKVNPNPTRNKRLQLATLSDLWSVDPYFVLDLCSDLIWIDCKSDPFTLARKNLIGSLMPMEPCYQEHESLWYGEQMQVLKTTCIKHGTLE